MPNVKKAIKKFRDYWYLNSFFTEVSKGRGRWTVVHLLRSSLSQPALDCFVVAIKGAIADEGIKTLGLCIDLPATDEGMTHPLIVTVPVTVNAQGELDYAPTQTKVAVYRKALNEHVMAAIKQGMRERMKIYCVSVREEVLTSIPSEDILRVAERFGLLVPQD